MQVYCVRPDVDHVAFTLPADAKGLSWRASWTQGAATFRISVDGAILSPTDPLPFKPGMRYDFEVTSPTPTDYAIVFDVER
jgi:hypothetical protein